MRYIFTSRFVRSYHSFPGGIQKKFDKSLGYLIKNLRHPSLRAKKYSEKLDIWQARVDNSVRFYFFIEGDTYVLLDIKYHLK